MPDYNFSLEDLGSFLTEELKRPLPGFDAQRKMLPVTRVNKKLKTIENSIRLSEQGGRSFAGNAVVKEKSPEELKKEKTMEFFKGTEVEQALKKHG